MWPSRLLSSSQAGLAGALPGGEAARVTPSSTPTGAESSTKKRVLVLHSWIESIKFGLVDVWFENGATKTRRALGGRVESIGGTRTSLTVQALGSGVAKTEMVKAGDHAAAVSAILDALRDRGLGDFAAVGHRVVHGGESTAPAFLNESTLNLIEKHIHLAPLHNPAALETARGALALFETVPQLAVFDTAFHAEMPEESYRYAVPKELYENHGVRRWGFHGTSYAYVTEQVNRALFNSDPKGRGLILCHLGRSGASMCVVKDGKCLDTTMGLTPLEGLVGGTRSGDVDPGLHGYLARELGKSPTEVDTVLNTASGLLGMSGVSADMKAVKEAAMRGDADAQLARRIYVERVRKYLGAYLVKLRGECDGLVFCGIVGETDAELRERICEGLESFGIALDPVLNLDAQEWDEDEPVRDVGTPFGRIKVIVAQSNEEETIARQASEVLRFFVEDAKKHEAKVRAAAKKSVLARSASSQERAQVLSPKKKGMLTEKGGTTAPRPTPTETLPPLGRAVYIDGVGPTNGEEVGLLYQALPYAPKLGYFMPFAEDDDRKLTTVRTLFQLDEPASAMRGATATEAQDMLAQGREDELLDLVIAKYVEYSADKDFVLVSRGDLGSKADIFWTAKVASALSLPVVYVCHDQITPRGFRGGDAVHRESPGDFVKKISEVATKVKEAVDARGGRLAGVVATVPRGVDRADVAAVCDKIGVHPAALLPYDPRFSRVAMAEIAESLGAKTLLGEPDTLASQIVRGVVVATRQVPETLETLRHMEPGQLLVTHAERTDLLMAVAMAQQAPDFPQIAGILLSGCFDGDVCYGSEEERARGGDGSTALRRALALLKRVPSSIRVPPVVAVDASTYEAASIVHDMDPVMLPTSMEKIEAAQVLFERHLSPAFKRALLTTFDDDDDEDEDGLENPSMDASNASTISTDTSSSTHKALPKRKRREAAVTTPKLFQHRLFSKARARKMTVVLPEGDDRRVVAAAGELVERGLCRVVLLGDPEAIRRLAVETRVERALFPDEPVISSSSESGEPGAATDDDDDGEGLCEILDPRQDSELRQTMVDSLHQARKHKGVSVDGALTLLREDPNYYGTMLLHLGLADGMVSGACHSTAATMRPPLQIIKMKPGFSIVSSVFFMLLADGVKVFGDCAINVSPNADELAMIGVASAQTARAFGLEPRVAMLSYATGDSNTGELIDKVRNATAKARETLPDELFEGPIQFDAAVDPDVAAVKYKGAHNSVAGKATVLVFPTLDAGNSAYKAVQQASKCVAVGPVMQGLRKPVNDLSRGCTVNDIVNTVVVTCIQAQAQTPQD